MTSVSLPPATRTSRLMARIIDSVFLSIAGVPFLMSGNSETHLTLGLATLTAITVYQLILLWKQGQTIGKQLLNIRIVSVRTGGNGGFVHTVVLRTILNGLLGMIPLYTPIDILCIFREDRRCLHDLLAETVVVSGGTL